MCDVGQGTSLVNSMDMVVVMVEGGQQGVEQDMAAVAVDMVVMKGDVQLHAPTICRMRFPICLIFLVLDCMLLISLLVEARARFDSYFMQAK